jgi:PadR family transcriptional regulator PadR
MMTPRKRMTDADPIESMLEEWKRGMLTYWALGLVCLQPMYGLEIKKEIESSTDGKIRLGASTIYQLMRRLEQRGLVVSRWQATTQGPPRAYYQATSEGRTLVWRYTAEVLSPTSPIPAALGAMMARLFEQQITDQPSTEFIERKES